MDRRWVDLHPGESEVLAWALAHPDHEAVIDDKAARTCAAHLGISCCGTVGVLVRAKLAGRLAAVRPQLPAARSAGLYVGTALEERALRLAGEG